MPIGYLINVLEELKYAGYNTNRLRQKKLLGENTIQALREGRMISMKSLATICQLLDRQPGDVIFFYKED
ncbi:MAG: helix-turn-helix domain-containing protein [Oscillibacter sp.]|nr:helix-turn-helix domain-containing protein [Oscillibacter sp.]